MKTRFLLISTCLIISIKINAQVLGCTDHLANNYNANATKTMELALIMLPQPM